MFQMFRTSAEQVIWMGINIFTCANDVCFSIRIFLSENAKIPWISIYLCLPAFAKVSFNRMSCMKCNGVLWTTSDEHLYQIKTDQSIKVMILSGRNVLHSIDTMMVFKLFEKYFHVITFRGDKHSTLVIRVNWLLWRRYMLLISLTKENKFSNFFGYE